MNSNTVNTTNTRSSHRHFTRRGIGNLLLATFAALAVVSPTGQALGHENRGKKPTELLNLTPTFTARRKQSFTFRAQLFYNEKTHPHKLKPLTYKSMPVEFEIQGIWKGSVMTDRYAWATVTRPLTYTGSIPPAGRTLSWTARYRGDSEHSGCIARGKFLLMP